tara:strand:- start:102465 stop:106670 length:4206 start_codon:yes stop_codon:yes gene_type:complete
MAAEIIIRLSIVLAIGWLALRISAKQNPRWSVLITRFLIVAGLGLPVVYLCLPSTTLAILPASLPVISEGEQTTMALPVNGDEVVHEEPRRQPLDQTTNVISEPVIVDTESSLSEPAMQESVAAMMVPQNEVNELSVSASDPVINSTVSLFQWLWFCWLAGCFLLLLKIGIQIKQAKHLLRTSESASDTLQRECEMLATKLTIHQIPRVCISTAINGPCTAGLFRPIVFLPQSWSEALSDSERRAVLMHELSHIAGHDSLWDLLSRIVTALWWFHPLVWRLTSQHRLACEHMSDARAADSISGLDAYRQMLAQWALRRQGAESNSAVLAMADRSFMLRRLKWLEVPRSFETLGHARRAGFLLIAVLIFISVASIKFVPQAIAQPPEVTDQEQDTEKSKQPPAEKEKAEKEQAEKNHKKQPVPLKQRPNVADIDTSQTTPKIIRVVDERDQPIAGANVRVGWWEDNEGDLQIVVSLNPPVTNEKGEVTIPVPKGAARVQISAEAPGYAKAGTQYSLSGEPTLILKQGKIVRVKAIDTKGRLLNDAYPLLEKSRIFGREFKLDKGRVGYFTSPVVSLDRRWMRVVDGSGEGPVLFSDLIDVSNPEQVTKDGAIVATLYAGIRLEGRLEDSVPRPIKNGCVELYISEAAEHRIGGGWTWRDTAFVNEDGTFVFDSLPAGGHVQLFALVDGYQSSNPSAESLAAYLKAYAAGESSLLTSVIERQYAFLPHLFPLPEGLYKTEIELPCVKTSSLDVTVVDPIGQPIKGATVKFNPNGLFLGWSQFIPTVNMFINSSLVRHKDPVRTKRLHAWATTFLSIKTDAKGIAAVRNLPASGRESYSVVADKYEMPIHPTSSVQEKSRYAVINLVGGKLQRRTITMEQHVPTGSREVVVVDRQAEPIPNINVTVSEIAFKETPDDWELWAAQRFGPIATGKTGEDGLVRLNVPLEVNGKAVARLRIAIQGRVGRDASVRKTLSIPRFANGRVVVLTVSDQPLKEKYHLRKVQAEYLDPKSLLSDSLKILLEQLLAKPSLVVLNRLLELAKFNAATPLRFRSDLNWTDFYKRKENERVPVVLIPTVGGDRVIVLCDVRPQDATWDVKPKGRSAPSAAFVFDLADGSLIRMIGGWASSSGSFNNLMLTNQGGTDDYFISTSAFEKHGTFEYIQRWYRVGQEKIPALTVHNHANATSRDAKDGPSSPLAEYGYLGFKFNGKQIDSKQGGRLPDGALVPRKIYWDGEHNQFIGPVTQSVDGQPLYQVVTENSAEFKSLDVKPGDIVAGGGRRYYQNWHWWDVVVPANKTAQLRLFLVDQSGDQPAEKEISVKELAAGLHSLQLQIVDSKDETQLSKVEIRIGAEEIKGLTVPRVPISNVPSVKDVPVARAAQSSMVLFDRPTEKENTRLIWKLMLQ